MQTEAQSNITYIPTGEIFPHPDNPRKHLGDLGELADSIKKNGIMQNLTVIKGHYQTHEEWQALSDEYKRNPSEETRIKMNTKHYDSGYTVIIGHRRLSAASLAGLETVPCIISEMDYKTQISVMLLENMQRNDLTVYEQAQAFGQLQFDLGASVEEISEMTGFSNSTVRRRLSLLELDKKVFEASQDRGGTLNDYMELEKISDIELKNKVLATIGTSNFNWALKNAIDTETKTKRKDAWFNLFNSIAEKVDYSERSKRTQRYSAFVEQSITDDFKEKIGRIVTDVVEEQKQKLFWCTDNIWVYLLGEENKEKSDAQEQGRKEAERTLKANAICELENRANELRTDFVRNYTGRKDDLPYLLSELMLFVDGYIDINYFNVAELLGIEIIKGTDDEWSTALYNNGDYQAAVKKYPQKVVLAYLFEIKNAKSVHNYYGHYTVQKGLLKFYEILIKVGYKPSDEELELINGTHKIFGGEEK